MKLNLNLKSSALTSILIVFFVVSSGAIFITACGSADGARTGKSNKKKKRMVFDDDEFLDEFEMEKEVDSESKSKSDESSNSNENPESGDAKKGKNEAAEKIWNDLIKGNQRFVAGKHTNVDFASVRKSLTDGQKPEVIVLGCADSRVPPEFVFDKNLGELFVVRTAGNIADTIALGSIEYAIEHLHSKVLVILGHENCGAVTAAMANEEMPTRNLSAIVNKIVPALEGSTACPLGGEMKNACVVQNVAQSAKDLMKNSSIVKKATEEGKLTIIGALYELESGKVVRQD